MAAVGDIVIVTAFGNHDDGELTDAFEPRKVFADARNRITQTAGGV